MSPNILLWTTSTRDAFTDALTAAGFRVWEALAVSEVMSLCESENIDVIIVSADITEPRYTEIRQHYITIKLEPKAETREIVETLWQMFPDRRVTVQ